MKLLTTLKSWWAEHGTKIIGSAMAVVGALAALDPSVIVTFLTTILGDRGPGIAVVVGGLLTFYRGFKNGKTNAAPQS